MKYQKWLLSIFSGLLLGFSWPYTGSVTPLIFIAFLPLLMLEEELYKEGKKSLWSAFKYAYPAFFIFNILTTYWIYNVQESLGTKVFSAGSAIVLNAAFMTIAFSLFHVTRSRVGNREGYISLFLYWIAWEYLHLNWELSWPWLTLGNVFSIHSDWVQWYEFTGILGGSIFILFINILFFAIYKSYLIKNKRGMVMNGMAILVIFLGSLLFESISFSTKAPKTDPIEIILVQPNVDPYNEKFQYESADIQLIKMLDLAKTKITDSTKIVLFPETALQERTTLFPQKDSLVLIGLWENNIEQSNSIRMIRQFLEIHPQLTMIFGVSSDRLQAKDEEIIAASRYIPQLDVYYQSYNAALIVEKDRKVEFYHKSELVPAVEFMPLQWLLKPLMNLAIDMGGTSGTLGTQEDQIPFFTKDSIGISPAICYESIYGDVNAEFVENGAQILGIITNDGWWADSPGYKQHVSYARLRAIESRKWVARSANTGISCFIDPCGHVMEQSNWWVESVLKMTVYPNDIMTFYSKYGDYLGRIAAFLSVLMLLYTMVRKIKYKHADPL
jgi:apolipoprotein N-acyltransferase